MFGYRPDEFTAQVDQWNQMVHPDDLPATQTALADYMNGRTPLFQTEQRLRTKAGAYKWVLARGKVSGRDAAGQPVRMTGTHSDITERKQAETALRESEARLVRAQAVAHIGNWELTLATGTIWASAEAFRIYGLERTTPEIALETAQRLAFPEDRARMDAALRTALRDHTAYAEEYRIVRANDGKLRFLQSLASVEQDPAGRPVKVVGTIQDITERKQAEEALRESEAKARTILGAVQAGILIIDPETHTIVDVNQAAAKLIGETPERIVGSLCHRFICPAEEGKCPITDLKQTVDNSERVLLKSDGTRIPIIKTIVPVTIGKRSCLLEEFVDISQLKRTEESQARLATAVEQAAETIVITDPRGTIVYANPAFERITGFSREEALGQNPRLLKSGKHDANFYRRMWETLLAGQVWSGRIINKRKDGQLIEEEATLSPVFDTAGKLINFVAVKRDVTREVALEVQNRQAAKMEAVGQLAGGVAHDFNNQLQVILGSAEVILESVPADAPIREDLQEIQKAARHSADLTRQLLAFSRKQMIAPVVLDVNAAISGSLKMFSRLIGENIRLNFVLARESWRVFMDPSQLDQILANLAVNARDAIAGQGKISIVVANQKLQEDDCREKPDFVTPGDYVVLSVSDDGVGMTPEVQARIFEPFFTTKGVGEGTGLGLATIYGIVKQNRGAIVVQSMPGHGTTFTIYLPRSKDAGHGTADAAAEAPRPTGTETVLVVEDQESVLLLVQRTLSRQGYDVLTAPTPRQALQLCERRPEPIHLLLTDVIMPDMGGMELADRIQALRPGIRVLFMSGYTDDIMQQQGHLPASRQVLQKPFTAATLAQQVRAVLDAPPAPPPGS